MSNTQIVSFFAAFFVHGSIATFVMLPSKPLVINQQAIQVSFVAPTSSQKNQQPEAKITKNVENQNALKQKQGEKNLLANKKTSGRQDSKALETKAAESEPLFNTTYLNNPAPEYPEIAKRRGIQGKVLVDVLVKSDGTPALVKISRSSGSNNLDNAAIEAVRQWKFIPARRGGLSVQASVIVPVEFKII